MNIFSHFISNQIVHRVQEQTLYNLRTQIFLPLYHLISKQRLLNNLIYSLCNSTDLEKDVGSYLSFEDELRECSKIAPPTLLKKKSKYTFMNSVFADNREFFVKKFPLLHPKKYGQNIYSSFEINNNKKLRFQDGDGDVVFT